MGTFENAFYGPQRRSRSNGTKELIIQLSRLQYKDSVLVYAPLIEIMHIFIKTLTGRTITLAAEASDSIDCVRQYIQSREGVPTGLQRLSLGGRPMCSSNNSSLADYNVQNGDTLDLNVGLLGGTRYWEDELHANADGSATIAAASNTNPKKEGVIKKRKSVTVEKKDDHLECITHSTLVHVPGKKYKKHVHQSVKLYGSSSVSGACLRDARTGIPFGIRAGSAEAGRLFKVVDVSGFARKTPLTLYYSGPSEYEDHLNIVLNDDVKIRWHSERQFDASPTPGSPSSDEDYVVVK